MFSISSSLHGSSSDDFVTDRVPVQVTAAGRIRVLTKSSYTTYRPHGRDDYQLMYINDGSMRFDFPEGAQTVSSGNAVVYYPNERQSYTYTLQNRSDVYWLHFSGSAADVFIKKTGLGDRRVTAVGQNGMFRFLAEAVIKELQLKRKCFEENANAYFLQLLVLMSRDASEQSVGTRQSDKLIHDAINQINLNYSAPFSVTDFAAAHSISVCWFTRLFRQYTDCSPHAYLTRLRLERAKELLVSTDMSISEISELTGYVNPLYFSRLFRKYESVPPAEYRKRNR